MNRRVDLAIPGVREREDEDWDEELQDQSGYQTRSYLLRSGLDDEDDVLASKKGMKLDFGTKRGHSNRNRVWGDLDKNTLILEYLQKNDSELIENSSDNLDALPEEIKQRGSRPKQLQLDPKNTKRGKNMIKISRKRQEEIERRREFYQKRIDDQEYHPTYQTRRQEIVHRRRRGQKRKSSYFGEPRAHNPKKRRRRRLYQVEVEEEYYDSRDPEPLHNIGYDEYSYEDDSDWLGYDYPEWGREFSQYDKKGQYWHDDYSDESEGFYYYPFDENQDFLEEHKIRAYFYNYRDRRYHNLNERDFYDEDEFYDDCYDYNGYLTRSPYLDHRDYSDSDEYPLDRVEPSRGYYSHRRRLPEHRATNRRGTQNQMNQPHRRRRPGLDQLDRCPRSSPHNNNHQREERGEHLRRIREAAHRATTWNELYQNNHNSHPQIQAESFSSYCQLLNHSCKNLRLNVKKFAKSEPLGRKRALYISSTDSGN